MGAMDQTHADNLLDASLGTAALVATVPPLHFRLMTVNGDAVTNGTELATSGGYTAGTGAPSVTFAAAAAGSAASSAAYTITNMPATTVVGGELWDSAPARKWWGALTAPRTTNSGDTLTVDSGAMTAQLP